MKASELITQLNEAMKEHGDLECSVSDIDAHDNGGLPTVSVAGVVVECDEHGKAEGFMIADDNSMDAFTETDSE